MFTDLLEKDGLTFEAYEHEDGVDWTAEVYEHGLSFDIALVRDGYLASSRTYREVEPFFAEDWERAIDGFLKDVRETYSTGEAA